jgi:GNAT superfamily N-acetyltransferase
MIKKATSKDVAVIWKLTKELAAYEGYAHECTITQTQTRNMFFGKLACAECYLIVHKNKIIGMGKLIPIMETYSGIPFFLLRDFYVQSRYRGNGYGQQFMHFMTQLATKRGYSEIQWNVLNWNKSAINFYKKLGAKLSKTVRMSIDYSTLEKKHGRI